MGVFYPKGTKPADFITEYAKRFHTVEMDSTWHHMPSESLIRSLERRTPSGFIFSAKVPDTITHKKYLEDCDEELHEFLNTMSLLGGKLGPLVFQFPYVAKGKDSGEYKSGALFRAKLAKFLPKLSKNFRYAVEIRNAYWLKPPLLDLLRRHRAALVLSAYHTMPALDELLQNHVDPLTTDYALVRFIGHRKEIEALIQAKIKKGEKKREFDEIVMDRTSEMRRWVAPLARLLEKGIPTYIYFNNHYAGHGPASARLFETLWIEMTGRGSP